MSDLYVIIGDTRQKENGMSGASVDEGVLGLGVASELLDNTYRQFMAECVDICKENFGELTPTETNVYELMNDALNNNDVNMKYTAFLYNRDAKNFGEFSLEQNVKETAGEYMYHSTQMDETELREFKTLEMYIRGTEKGGRK